MRIDAPRELQHRYRQVLLNPFVKAGPMLIELDATLTGADRDKNQATWRCHASLASNP